MCRVDGTLVPLNEDVLTPDMVEELIAPILDDRKRNDLNTKGEIDFAYSLQGIGRFRLNVFCPLRSRILMC